MRDGNILLRTNPHPHPHTRAKIRMYVGVRKTTWSSLAPKDIIGTSRNAHVKALSHRTSSLVLHFPRACTQVGGLLDTDDMAPRKSEDEKWRGGQSDRYALVLSSKPLPFVRLHMRVR